MEHVHRRARHRPGPFIAAGLVAMSLVAAACGSSASNSANTTSGGAVTTAAGGGNASTTVSTAAPAPSTTAAPQPGGKLVFAVEAEAAQPWTPANVQCDSPCQVRARTFFEPLAALDATTKKVEPYLAQSITANANSTVFTVKLRPGVTFSDGTSLNSDVAVDNINRARKSFLVGAALADLANVTKVDDLTFTITTKVPWYDFPYYMTGQGFFMASSKWLAAVDKDPNLAAKPIGTGPFIMQSYTPGQGMVVTKNPDYWRKAEGIPYLDEIDFRVIPDATTRLNALKAGDIDMMQTDDGLSIKKLRTDKSLSMVEQSQYGETFYIMLNVGQAGSPLQDQGFRCGLTAAIDTKVISQAIDGGILPIANGPFSPGQIGHLDNSGNQQYDPAKAKQLIAAYTAAHGGQKPKIIYSTINDQQSLRLAELVQQFWSAAGVDVQIVQMDQSKLITNALLGDPQFNAFGWRNHAGLSLDNQYFWWSSQNAQPPGQLALNFGRLKDPVIDQLLAKNRSEPDPAKREQYADQVNQEFAKQCWIIPTRWVIWGIPGKPSIQGIGQSTFPGGKGLLADGAGFPGQVWFNSIWVKK